MTIKRGYIAFLLMGIMMGCSSSDLCMQEMKVRLNVEFKEMKYDTSSEQFKEQTRNVNVIVNGDGIDSLLYDRAMVNKIELPLQMIDSISVYVVQQLCESENDTSYVSDTLWVEHENSIEFVSVECGSVVVSRIKNVLWTVNRIDSVTVLDGDVNRAGKSNLKIFVRK